VTGLLVKPAVGRAVEGFLIGYGMLPGSTDGQDIKVAALRCRDQDALVPCPRLLEQALDKLNLTFKSHLWIRIVFEAQVSLPRGYKIWQVQVRAARNAHPRGLRGKLRREGRRLVRGANAIRHREFMGIRLTLLHMET
jgi:hypothetical protein